MNYHIAIPTRNREILTIANLGLRPKDVTIFVDTKKQAAALGNLKGSEIVVTGTNGIAQARNAILDHFGKGEHVVMMDDDVKSLWTLSGPDKLNKVQNSNIPQFIKSSFEACIHNGTRLWGVYPIKNHFFMGPGFHPAGFCISTFSGIIVGAIRFDEEMVLKEDYDFTIQHIVKYGKVLRYNSVCVEAIHYTNAGGCQDYRSDAREQDSVNFLISKWPNAVKPNPRRKGEVLLNFKVRRK